MRYLSFFLEEVVSFLGAMSNLKFLSKQQKIYRFTGLKARRTVSVTFFINHPQDDLRNNAGKTYKGGITELPHVDVHYNIPVNGIEKQRFPIGGYLYELE
jgi:hypothetical protein